MRSVMMVFCLMVAGTVAGSGTGDVIRCCAELMASTLRQDGFGRPFEMTVRMTTDFRLDEKPSFAVEDESGAMLLYGPNCLGKTEKMSAGSLVRVRGIVDVGKRSRGYFAHCQELMFLATGPAPSPVTVSAEAFLSGEYDCRLVRIRGVVRDIVPDEIDSRYVHLVLSLDGQMVFVPSLSDRIGNGRISTGSEIEVSGICTPSNLGARRQVGRQLTVFGSDIGILSAREEDPFGAPDISETYGRSPQEIALLGRHRTVGRVIALWHGTRMLLKTETGGLVGVENSARSLPNYGDKVEVVGFPESDLYRINLGRAVWRRLSGSDGRVDEPVPMTVDQLRTDVSGRRCFDPYAHGRAIRLRGIVRTLPRLGDEDGVFSVESGPFIVSVDSGATPAALRGLSVGCEIEVSGTCIMESDGWRPSAPFPTIRGFTIAIRTPDDIEIVSYPSWWTSSRLLMVVGVLLVVLFGLLAWNAMLNRLAERRGRELAKTAVAKAESDLRVFERTRLAVELHDTISQNLTGVSLAIRAAERVRGTDAELLGKNLKLAADALNSCRRELKNCLWDLRNLTLDEADLNDAIRQTLEPHIGDAGLTVRFNVPRDRFSDRAAHAILHVLRELASNAVRHGNAEHIRIAGSVEGDTLLFSVRDDGCGFDPDSCPGMNEGHYGLQGVRERVNQLGGELKIESGAGTGTRVSVSVQMSKSDEGVS